MAKTSFSSANSSMDAGMDAAIAKAIELGDKALDLDKITAQYEAKLANVNKDLADTQKLLLGANASAQKFEDKFNKASATINVLNSTINALNAQVDMLSDKGDFTKTFQRSVTEFQAYLRSVNFSDIDGYYNSDISDWIDEIQNGAITAGEAIERFKINYKEFILTANSGDAGAADFLNSLSVTLTNLESQLVELMDITTSIKEEGVKAVQVVGGETDTMATSTNTAGQAMAGLSEASQEAYKSMTELVSVIRETSSSDLEGLSTLQGLLLGLGQISANTFGDKTRDNLVSFITQLQGLAAAGQNLQPIRLDLSGLAELQKVDKGVISALIKLSEAVDAHGEALKQISEIGQGVAAFKQLLETDPSNGINNLKVSKASLSNLKEYLPQIAGVNTKKLQEIFGINTAGINSLKVSKASVENVANLARAADILRTNGIDLSLKGDAIEEINKLTQETVDAADAAKNLQNNLEEVGHADGTNKSLERTSDLLGGITVELKQFNDETKLADINKALKWEGVDKQSRDQLLSIFKDMEGSITSVQAKWKDFGVNNEHISQVLIKGIDDVGRAFSRVINWKQEADEETGNVGFIAEQTDTIQYAIAQEEKLVEIDGRLADVTIAKKKAQDAYNNAIEAGVKSGELNQMKNLIGSYEMLEDAIKKGGVAQNDYALFMSNAASKSRLLTSVLREQTAALKEQETEMVNSKAASLELQNAQLKIQGVIDKALSNGVTEDNEALRGLIDMRDWFSLLEEEIQRVGMSQENYDYALENSVAEIQLYSKQLGFAIQLNRQEAAAAKEAAKAEAARVNQTQARGAITTERGRVSGIINNATGLGLSDQDANLQSLVTYTNLLDILESELESANLTQKEFNTIMGNLKSIFKEPEIAVRNLIKALKEQEAHIAKSVTVYKDIEQACQDYAKAADSTDANVRGAYDGIKKLSSILDNASEKLRAGTMTGKEYDDVVRDTAASLQEYRKTLDDAGYGTDQMSSKFAALAQQLTRFITPLYLARKAWQTIKDMANVVIELEDAFAQLQIVTGATDKELEEFYDTAANIATTLGKSITDIAASIEVFSRLGYTLPDATTLAQYATILSNVASVSTDEATTGLTSIIKGYNMHVEQAEHVSDVLVDIGQKYAVSAGEMMSAYERAGAALAATNTSFDKSAAIIAAANAAIQNANTVGKVLPMHTVMYA